jgi:predicted SAM-dependent methyltransferase
MSSFGTWVAQSAQKWLDGFRLRHGLGNTHQTPSADISFANPVENDRLLLHVGCGHANIKSIPLAGFRDSSWKEIRFDADSSVLPDITGSMASMSAIPDGFADAIYSSHGIEHLYWHDISSALGEFHRTLKDDGFAVITCPDVQAAAQMVAEDRMFETAYQSPAGPITPFDILYSYRPFVAANPEWMSHHCGFTLTTLTAVLQEARFSVVQGFRRASEFSLWVLASKSHRSTEEMAVLIADYLPVSD